MTALIALNAFIASAAFTTLTALIILNVFAVNDTFTILTFLIVCRWGSTEIKVFR